MGVVDDIAALAPTQYEVMRLAFQQTDSGLVAFWDVRIRNAAGRILTVVHPANQPDMSTTTALASFYNASKAAFETATGLTEWVPPEEE